MASSLSVFTFVSILIQTLGSIFFAWLTLECKLQPEHDELQEITMIKLLYLFEPKACERTYFYNYTYTYSYNKNNWVTIVQWPTYNIVAAKFRQKVQINVAIHILWLLFCLAYMMQGHRPCGFYAALLPFTLTGVINCAVDILNTILFIADTHQTSTEYDILKYINEDNKSLNFIEKTNYYKAFSEGYQAVDNQDTSWISLLFAYISCRGIVLWIFNFWMIKDNYFEGLNIFRHNQHIRLKELARIRMDHP